VIKLNEGGEEKEMSKTPEIFDTLIQVQQTVFTINALKNPHACFFSLHLTPSSVLFFCLPGHT
jgi:hypothetical protein